MKHIIIADMTWLNEESYLFSQQMGLKALRMAYGSPEAGAVWDADKLCRFQEDAHKHGLNIAMLESGVSLRVMGNDPNKEAHYEAYVKSLEAAKKANIEIVGYNFMAASVNRTMHPILHEVRGAAGTGGTLFTSYHHKVSDSGYYDRGVRRDDLKAIGYNEEMLWEDYTKFMEYVLPEAKRIGIKLGLHPDDPPVPSIDGIPRLFYSVENFIKAWEIAQKFDGGDCCWGFDLCLGSLSELDGENTVHAMIDFFGPKGCIYYGHFRDVQGKLAQGHGYFQECWLGEGNQNMAKTMLALSEKCSNDLYLIDDHVGFMQGGLDDGAHRVAHAREIGYMFGLIAMADYLKAQG